jgi:dephospho-CoA kinase
MIIIGITGLIGSGKTEVCKILQKNFAIPVIYTDRLAKYIYKKDKNIRNQISTAFGNNVISEDGRINTKNLGELVFSDKKKLKSLEKIIHPAIIKLQNNLINFFLKKKNKNILAIESALLLKLEQCNICDYIIYINANEEVRNKRLSASMLKREKYQEKFNNVITDYTIYNNGTKEKLEIEVNKVIKEIIRGGS